MVTRRKRSEAREERITMEIVVDACGAEEQVMSWYYHLESLLCFPFVARCIKKRAISPLKVGDEVEVVGLPPADECEREMFVAILSGKNRLAVPLIQLCPIRDYHPETMEAIEDWHYWVDMGYQFG